MMTVEALMKTQTRMRGAVKGSETKARKKLMNMAKMEEHKQLKDEGWALNEYGELYMEM